MNNKFDVIIIGAGPCGIACAHSLLRNGQSVAIIELGRDCKNRICKIDFGDRCTYCNPCNVMSGFGGCLHYGDAVKVSLYPSGKNLYKKIGEDEYRRLENIVLNEWNLSENDFVNRQIEDIGQSFNVKSYPVSVLDGIRLKGLLDGWRCSLEEQDRFTYIHGCAKEVVSTKDGYEVSIESGRQLICENIVLAVGRMGIEWIGDICNQYGINTDMPYPSVGVRFIIPSEALVKIGRMHPDFKIKVERNGIKYKSFCFCGGEHGGRIKHLNYGRYMLLDGHVLSEQDEKKSHGNFAILRQLSCDKQQTSALLNDFIESYKNIFDGKTVCERYSDFRSRGGKLYQLYDEYLDEYCAVAEDVFGFIADFNNMEEDQLMKDIQVEGPEVEGMWHRVHSDEFFMVDGRGMYVGGDCAGETQGVFQAYMIGLRIADGIIGKRVK